jgi:hypothetical protein
VAGAVEEHAAKMLDASLAGSGRFHRGNRIRCMPDKWDSFTLTLIRDGVKGTAREIVVNLDEVDAVLDLLADSPPRVFGNGLPSKRRDL